MPRRPRLRIAGMPFHVIQRGNNRTACFFRREDYERYLGDLRAQAGNHGAEVHAYVLMTNHVHLLITPREADALGRIMKHISQKHSQYVNRRYGRSGALWQGRFRSCLVDSESYLLQCHRYIECNPVRASMVRHPGAYPWSSFRANALGASDPVVTPHACVLALGSTLLERNTAYRALFHQDLDPAMVDRIRSATNGGLVFGSERFKKAIARALGRVAREGERRKAEQGV